MCIRDRYNTNTVNEVIRNVLVSTSFMRLLLVTELSIQTQIVINRDNTLNTLHSCSQQMDAVIDKQIVNQI